MPEKAPPMSSFRMILPALLVATCLSSSGAFAAPLNQSVTSDDLSYTTLPEGGVISSMSGDVQIQTSNGPLSVRGVSGDIKISKNEGPTSLTTVSGDAQIGQGLGAVQIKTVSGDIAVAHAAGGAALMTVSGDTQLGGAAGDVTVKSTSGDQDVTLVSTGSARKIILETVSGDVTLHLPHDFGGTFDITLRQSRQQRAVPLEQSLGLTVQFGPWEKQGFLSSESRTITATGTVGNGRDHVTIHGVSGKVRILQD